MAGSIEKRGKDSWRLTVGGGTDANGKRIKYTKTIKASSPRAAEKQLALMIAEIEKGQFVHTAKLSFAEFIDRWIKDYAETNLAPKTLFRYRQMLESRIISALGHLKIEQIKPVHLLDFYKNLQEHGVREDVKYTVSLDINAKIKQMGLRIVDLKAKSGMSDRTIKRAQSGEPVTQKTAISLSSALEMDIETLFTKQEHGGSLSSQTIKHHHRLISAILQDAVEWQVIHSNPAKRVKPPKVKKVPGACYNEEQTAALLLALEKEPIKYKMIVTLAVATGLRRGELMGLEWPDINFDNSTVKVRQSSQYLPGKGQFTKDPKNEMSKRIVSVPASVMTLLKKYKASQAEEKLTLGDLWIGSDRIFTTGDGQPMHPDTISKWFPKFLRRHNLPALPFHGLRHTSATLLISQGLHAKTISSRLGHSNISTTMDIYGHALKRADKEAADKLDFLFDNSNAKENKKRQA